MDEYYPPREKLPWIRISFTNLHTCSEFVHKHLNSLHLPLYHRVFTPDKQSLDISFPASLDPTSILVELTDAGFNIDNYELHNADDYNPDDLVQPFGVMQKASRNNFLVELAESGDNAARTARHLQMCQQCQGMTEEQREELEEQTKIAHQAIQDQEKKERKERQEKLAEEERQTQLEEEQMKERKERQENLVEEERQAELEEERMKELEKQPQDNTYEATISIGGMTCTVCSGKITETLEALPWVKSLTVNLMTHSGTVIFDSLAAGGADKGGEELVDEINDLGYEAALDRLKLLGSEHKKQEMLPGGRRTVQLSIEGMHCEGCVSLILDHLRHGTPEKTAVSIEGKPLTLENTVVTVSYTPIPSTFTIRELFDTIAKLDPKYKVSMYHPPTIEERSHKIQLKERKDLLNRFAVNVVCAIPTLLIGIIWMMLVPRTNRQRVYFDEYMWVGAATRGEWALFFLSTPVMFYCAYPFHRRAIQEIVALWRPASTVPIAKRFYRFGSMNLLISLGVSISYIASIVMLALAARRDTHHSMESHTTTYFDSTVFLSMFLLMGRYLEAYSKAKTANAVSLISNLRPKEAMLLKPETGSASPALASSHGSAVEEVASINKEYSDGRNFTVVRVPADNLEVGDIVLVGHGASPPADATMIKGESGFDESSLTGEARLVPKTIGDLIYAGTINQGSVVNAVVSKTAGESMIDNIVNVVREGQSRPAPIERIADQVTAYFVPIICLLAVTVFFIWLILGLGGALPYHWLKEEVEGGWAFWSLSFAIAVFVVACPCGIGLAAPCAMHVGASLAAEHAILAKGGGEAFQEASRVSCVVFDKTGTLTTGEEPEVTAEHLVLDDKFPQKHMYYIVRSLEETSSHPLARAIVACVSKQPSSSGVCVKSEEIPGKGVKGTFTVDDVSYDALIGSERFITEHPHTDLSSHNATLEEWKSSGQSTVLFAVRHTPLAEAPETPYSLYAIYGTSDPIRPEALPVITYLRSLYIDIWMITGDARTTALAIARTLQIPEDHVIAGVLPTEKATYIKQLQTLPSTVPQPRGLKFWSKPREHPRHIVAMVGDGINDSPALATADVGIAIGSGADVALQTAKFILVSSNLTSLVTLIELSQKVIRRVKFNFVWACAFNIIAIPLAAGVLMPAGNIRLSPVWAALAMALSSVSVILLSVGLKWGVRGVKFTPGMGKN